MKSRIVTVVTNDIQAVSRCRKAVVECLTLTMRIIERVSLCPCINDNYIQSYDTDCLSTFGYPSASSEK